MIIEQREAGVDKYGIKKIYPDAADDDRPEHQYLDMNDIKAGRVDRYPDTYKKSNEDVPGGFKAERSEAIKSDLRCTQAMAIHSGALSISSTSSSRQRQALRLTATMTMKTGSSSLTLAEAPTTARRRGAAKETR